MISRKENNMKEKLWWHWKMAFTILFCHLVRSKSKIKLPKTVLYLTDYIELVELECTRVGHELVYNIGAALSYTRTSQAVSQPTEVRPIVIKHQFNQIGTRETKWAQTWANYFTKRQFLLFQLLQSTQEHVSFLKFGYSLLDIYHHCRPYLFF